MNTELEIMLAEMTLAIRDGYGFVIEVMTPELTKPEVITNPKENITVKRDYYSKNYTDDLFHVKDNNVKIVKYYRSIPEKLKRQGNL